MKIKKKLEENYKNNVRFIIENFPGAWENFFKPKGKIKTQLIIEKNNNVNFIYNGIKGIPSSDSKKKLISSIKNNMYTLRLYQAFKGYPLIENKENYISYKYLNKIISLFRSKDLKYSPLKKTIPLLIIVGLNLGYHLEWILDNYNVKYLVIIEVDENLANLSLYTLNWEKIFRYFQKDRSRYIKLVIFSSLMNPDISDKELDTITLNLINTVLQDVDFFSIDFRFLSYYANPTIDRFMQKFTDNIEIAYRGWGFFDDEEISIKHTYQNLQNNIKLLHNEVDPKDIPVFIVGSGPSLDDSIDVIKKHEKNAVIISAGTSLRKLLKNGIKPDIHIEIERTVSTYHALKKQLKGLNQKLLKDTLLVCANPVHPDVFTKFPFKDKGMFLKYNDTGYYGFFEKYGFNSLHFSNPTVTNGALAVAEKLGFRQMYLFGVDFGFKTVEKHHADDTIYYDKEIDEKPDMNINQLKKVKGNFTDFVYTNGIFNFSRIVVERMLNKYKHIKVYNTSDGAFINGTIPLKASELPQFKTEKKSIVESIHKTSFITPNLNPQQDLKHLKDNIRNIILNIINFLKSQKVKSFDDFFFIGTEIAIYIRKQKEFKPLYPLFMGTTKHILLHSYLGYIYLNESKVEKIKYLNECKNILLSFYEEALAKIDGK